MFEIKNELASSKKITGLLNLAVHMKKGCWWMQIHIQQWWSLIVFILVINRKSCDKVSPFLFVCLFVEVLYFGGGFSLGFVLFLLLNGVQILNGWIAPRFSQRPLSKEEALYPCTEETNSWLCTSHSAASNKECGAVLTVVVAFHVIEANVSWEFAWNYLFISWRLLLLAMICTLGWPILA